MTDDGSIVHTCPAATTADAGASVSGPSGSREEVRRAEEYTDDVVTEAWERVTDEPEIRGVEAGWLEGAGGWHLGVAVMEFVREGDPPYDDLVHAIETTVRTISDVTDVQREDTEVWWVTGTPSGEQLVRAVAEVIDQRAAVLREHYNRLG